MKDEGTMTDIEGRRTGRLAPTEWNRKDLEDLGTAAGLLENPGFIARVSGLVGTPIEFLLDKLPKGAGGKITRAVHESLRAAMNAAAMTLGKRARGMPKVKGHAAAVGFAGGVGGIFGLAGLPIELPITTTIILRSIADIARGEGEDLSDPESRMACLEVFAMGGPSRSDDASESGYFAVRAALARAVSEAARYVAQRSVVEDGAPVIVRLLAQIAARFNTVVGEKIMAQGVPVVGALGGATINLLFIDHFQAMARGHFIVRRLEREYGSDEVRRMYDKILAARV
jgi:hypothetical protein